MALQLDDQEKIDRAARHEEVRFTKKQQWSVTTSAVTLLAAIFGIAHLVKPGPHERCVATLFILIILGSAWLFLWKLQDSSERNAPCGTQMIAGHGFAAGMCLQCCWGLSQSAHTSFVITFGARPCSAQ